MNTKKQLRVVIAISGKLRAGKDSIAQIILDLCGSAEVERVALADALKEECEELYGISVARMEQDYSYKEAHRATLIGHGAKRRAEDIDYWVKKVIERATHPIVLVPDLRYTNEIQSLERQADNLITIRVWANDWHRKAHGWTPSPADQTQSECQLDDYTDWDYVIENNGSLADLRRRLQPILYREHICTKVDHSYTGDL